MMRETVEVLDKGIARQCADDVGAVLRGMVTMVQFKEVFDLSEMMANLRLKPRKCIVVPLARYKLDLVHRIKSWMNTHIPAWSAFKIMDRTKFLGFIMGPAVAGDSWVDPVAKTVDRSKIIASSGQPPSMAILQANSRAAPCIGYVAQILFPRSELWRVEREVGNRICHLPPGTLSRQALAQLGEV